MTARGGTGRGAVLARAAAVLGVVVVSLAVARTLVTVSRWSVAPAAPDAPPDLPPHPVD